MHEKQVAIISPSKFPGTDGSSANFSEMINQLIREGFKILLICPKNPDSHDENITDSSSYLRIVRIPCSPPRLVQIKDGMNLKHSINLFVFLIMELFTVLWTLRSKKFVYVFLRHSILTMQLPLLLKLMGISIIADGELLRESGIRELHSSRFLRLILFYERQIIKMYTYFKVSTQVQAENMERWGFSRERILKIPVSIDIERVPRFVIKEIPEHTFGYFGVLERWQGVDVLLKAFQIVHTRISTATLYVIGEGSMKDTLKKIVSENNLSSNVIFVNGMPREALWHNYFSKFRIVIIPRPKLNNSTDAIPSIKLIESLAAGKPIIAIDIPAMKEIPKTPFLLIPSAHPMILANAMETLSKNSKKLWEYSECAIDAANNYDIKVNIKKLTAVISPE